MMMAARPKYIRSLALWSFLKWISWASVRPVLGGAAVVVAVMSGSRRGGVGGDRVARVGGLGVGGSLVLLLGLGRSLDDVGPTELDEQEGRKGDQGEDDGRQGRGA